MTPFLNSNIPGFPCRRGKVRDVYDLGPDTLAVVTTDRHQRLRLGAADRHPGQGPRADRPHRVLAEFSRLPAPPAEHRPRQTCRRAVPPGRPGRPHHARPQGGGGAVRVRGPRLPGRVRVEGVPGRRGRCAGSGCRPGCGRATGCRQAVFTPATKAARAGTTRTCRSSAMAAAVGEPTSGRPAAVPHAVRVRQGGRPRRRAGASCVADTKLEWGVRPDGELILVDEVLTPDSSRFWPADRVPARADRRRRSTSSTVRDWLEAERLGQGESAAAAAAGRGGRDRRSGTRRRCGG